MRIVTKAEFARLVGKDRSAVAHWIKDGKLTTDEGGGLIQHNGKQQIDVVAACARLKLTLDAAQSLGNSADTHDSLDLLSQGETPAPAPEPTPDMSEVAEDKRRYSAARTERAEQVAALGRRDLASEMGRWVEKAEAQKVFYTEAQKLMDMVHNIVETALPLAVAEALGVNPSDVTATIRIAYRNELAALSGKLSVEAAALEEKTEDETADAA